MLLILLFLNLACNTSSVIYEASSPNKKFQAFLVRDKQNENEITFQIIRENGQFVLNELFFREKAFETISSDYPNREWLSNSVFALGMFRSRQQSVQKLKINNYSEKDISHIRIAGFHNRIYIINIKANKTIRVPFYFEQGENKYIGRIFVQVHFADSIKRKENFAVPKAMKTNNSVLSIKPDKIELISES